MKKIYSVLICTLLIFTTIFSSCSSAPVEEDTFDEQAAKASIRTFTEEEILAKEDLYYIAFTLPDKLEQISSYYYFKDYTTDIKETFSPAFIFIEEDRDTRFTYNSADKYIKKIINSLQEDIDTKNEEPPNFADITVKYIDGQKCYVGGADFHYKSGLVSQNYVFEITIMPIEKFAYQFVFFAPNDEHYQDRLGVYHEMLDSIIMRENMLPIDKINSAVNGFGNTAKGYLSEYTFGDSFELIEHEDENGDMQKYLRVDIAVKNTQDTRSIVRLDDTPYGPGGVKLVDPYGDPQCDAQDNLMVNSIYRNPGKTAVGGFYFPYVGEGNYYLSIGSDQVFVFNYQNTSGETVDKTDEIL